MALFSFPLPIIGTASKILKHLKQAEDGKGPLFDTINEVFGEKVPPLILHFQGSHNQLFVTDPAMVQDIYVRYNRYFDKSGRFKNLLYDFFGNGLLFIESNELWREKRKHLSAAFYKEKMIAMLETVTELTYERI